MRCRACRKAKAEYTVNNVRVCKDCFIRLYERKILKIAHKYTDEKDKLLLAVSGGKDSISMAAVLARHKETLPPMTVLFLDMGVPCTVDVDVQIKEFCKRFGLDCEIVRAKDFVGFEISEVLKVCRRPACAVCALVRRYILNRFARQNGFTKIVTGHCADDIVKLFFKNWLAQQFDWIAKLKPYTPPDHPAQIGRLRPLFNCTEEENQTYANLFELKTVRNVARFKLKEKWDGILNAIEQRSPGFTLGFVKALQKFEFPKPKIKLHTCKECGEPASDSLCGVCKLKKLLK